MLGLLLLSLLPVLAPGFVTRNQRSTHCATALSAAVTKRLFLEVEQDGSSLGRLNFVIPKPDLVQPAILNQNFFQGCSFTPTSPETVPQYKWAHVLRAPSRLVATNTLAKYSTFGGEYYGLPYNEEATVLTVPLTGPNRYHALSIVRVQESPPEWKERLLLQTAVVGWMERDSQTVLQQLAKGAKVVASGVEARAAIEEETSFAT